MENMQIVPAGKNVEAQYVEMRVPLYSYGCERKVKKALSHLKGIYSVNVDFTQQKVTVWGICNKYDVLSTMRKKRKGSCYWNHEDDLEMTSQSEQEEIMKSSTAMSPISRAPRHSTSFNLTVARSLGLKAWKKVFLRSYSFS